ncbi:MAG: gamma-glutamylcyclotransferase [Oceanospirillaceae bacterium]|nr:gamma-glutamylcyclotransferase [Oceanospirillaceae bacterium]
MSAYPQSQILDALDRYLEACPLPEDLWIFAYGSLLWNPEMHVIKSKQGKVSGLQRGFNLLSTVHRGTLECPGLVLSLREGGHCEGMALQISKNTQEKDFKHLWLREMVTMFYVPYLCKVNTCDGDINAITFVADKQHEQYVDFDAAVCASMIGQAHGGRGSNIDYFNNTLKHLKTLDIHDPLFSDISRHLVANA